MATYKVQVVQEIPYAEMDEDRVLMFGSST